MSRSRDISKGTTRTEFVFTATDGQTTFSTDDNDPTSNNSISAFLQKTVMERSNAPLTCCIRKSNHNNHLAKNMMDLQ